MPFTIDRSIGNYFDASKGRLRRIGRLVGPANYTAGGEPFAALLFGFGTLEWLSVVPLWDGTNLRLGVYDHTHATLLVIDPTTGNEVAGGTNLSTFSGHFEAIGH